MQEVLNRIKEVQQEAKKIINAAAVEDEKLNQNLLQRSIAANEEAYLAEIAQAEKRADEMQKNSSSGIDDEIKQILHSAEKKAMEIETKAKLNQKRAVDSVIKMLFNKSEEK